jgi:hypothetical protein
MSQVMSHESTVTAVARPAKLTDADLKRIRRRVRAGEQQIEWQMPTHSLR